MSKWTRRDFLKSSVAAAAGAGSFPVQSAEASGPAPEARSAAANPAPMNPPAAASSSRERLLLDFGWRFHLGHADDPALDFGYGREAELQTTGAFFRPSRADFSDHDWRAIDLPHDWAVELPFQNDPKLIDHGAKPLGRNYPATSIGWYRRVFDIPKDDSGRRLSIEFDGVFRNSTIALNGNFLGRNWSGYAPFSCDITDFANYGGKNILVLRVDATEFEGWFYEGAGIYRHVWLVKTNPVHVPQWGTFVTSEIQDSGAVLTVA
ncbi:MAG TPA: twin-arginine translocation signal domain-containing protein, partial [Terriglobia bacterium]|nr:twin-arginine translocation signal domain-containing protein [Terriglobia bacterium]